VSEAGNVPAAGAAVIERLRAQPGGAALLELAHGRDDLELVGGAVRDLLLGRTPRELDVVVAADAPALAQTLARRLGAEATVHERFGTAYVEHGEARLDFATRRAESYPAPGALPEVRAGTPAEDLLRRDFSVNAIAVALGGSEAGALRMAPQALADLRAGRLRVLHGRSFLDDPTRLLRLARYSVRLGFAVESRTQELAQEAVRAGALQTLSGARIGAELRLALGEAQAPLVLDAMRELGLLQALHPRLRFERKLAERALDLLPRGARGRALWPRDGSRQALLLAVLVLPLVLRAEGEPDAEARALLDRLEFLQGERDLALAAATAVPGLLEELPRCGRASELYAVASVVPPEAVALAGALSVRAAGLAERWLMQTRYMRLTITGADLLAAGVPEGPEIGRRLRATLMLRLDGEVDLGREAELRAALELA
jgi:tRNA nucleotidyltransferase (CCA-adding enzyme)